MVRIREPWHRQVREVILKNLIHVRKKSMKQGSWYKRDDPRITDQTVVALTGSGVDENAILVDENGFEFTMKSVREYAARAQAAYLNLILAQGPGTLDAEACAKGVLKWK